MTLDGASVIVALTTSIATMAVALPAVMGRVSRPARFAQAGVGLQAAGWALLLVATGTPWGSSSTA